MCFIINEFCIVCPQGVQTRRIVSKGGITKTASGASKWHPSLRAKSPHPTDLPDECVVDWCVYTHMYVHRLCPSFRMVLTVERQPFVCFYAHTTYSDVLFHVLSAFMLQWAGFRIFWFIDHEPQAKVYRKCLCVQGPWERECVCWLKQNPPQI